jgi:arylformamidase
VSRRLSRLRNAAGFALALACAVSARAQDSSTYYTVRHPGEFKINWKAFYDNGDRMTAETRRELPHHLGLAYGADPKQRLDLYLPKTRSGGHPVFIFLHGGGMREGDRAHYGWVARPFAARGIVTVVASYRLTPRFHYPDQPEDVRSLVAWTYRNIKSFGGDPDKIYVGGHSAGAILSATVALDRDWQGPRSLPLDVIKGFVPVSGSYDVTASDTVSEYVPDPKMRVEASPLLNMDEPPPPAVIAVGSGERQLAPSRALADKLRAAGGKVELVVLDGLPHDATALAIADESSPLFKAIARLMAGAGPPSVAQDKSTYYTVRHPGEFKINWKAFYDRADALTAETRAAVPHTLDLPYGDDPKQRLDVYQPLEKRSAAPVFVFLHGGGFREGDRAHYGFVARPLAGRGIVTVVASYRLLPTARYPDQPDDVRRALAWVYRNIGRYGGDPNAVYVGGHSAGAILSADVSVRPDWLERWSLPKDLIKGCAPVSAPYDLRNEKAVNEYAADPQSRAEASPVLHVENPPPRCVVAVGTDEAYGPSSKELADKLRAKNTSVELVVLQDMDHAETALALGDSGGPLVRALVAMIEPDGKALEVEGLWRYRAIAPGGGPEVPIDGFMVFHDGRFVQQALNVGDPRDQQVAQAHAGTYSSDKGRLELIAEVGLVVNPARQQSVETRHHSRHQLMVARSGDALTLTFGSGTVQKLTRADGGKTRIYPLRDGALALSDEYFVLAAHAGGEAVAGSGRFVRDGDRLALHPDRWFSISDGRPQYAREPVHATFDEKVLRIPGQPPLPVRD